MNSDAVRRLRLIELRAARVQALGEVGELRVQRVRHHSLSPARRHPFTLTRPCSRIAPARLMAPECRTFSDPPRRDADGAIGARVYE